MIIWLEVVIKDLKKEIRKYNAAETLIIISKTINSMFHDNRAFDMKPIYGVIGSKKIKVGEQLISPWKLTDIAFYLIKYSNDYRGKTPNENEFGMLINAYDIAHESKTLEFMERTSIHEQLHGLSQWQFWYQDRPELDNSINREIEILLFCRDSTNSLSKDRLDEIVKGEFGFDLKWFYILTFNILAYTRFNTDLTTIEIDENLKKMDEKFNHLNFNKIIEFYSVDYKGIKESIFGVDHFSFKPIVKTDNGKIIVINTFLLAKKCSEGPYWFIRDHFEKKNSKEFLIEYGKYYEIYFQRLLERYLDEKSFHKLQENNNRKIADWVIYFDDFIIIIEQKSCLLPIKAKTEFIDPKALDTYIDRISKAFLQLNSTVDQLQDLEEKTVLKFVVHYEKLYLSSIFLDEKINNDILNFTNLFMVNINEIERLIYSMSKNIIMTKQILLEFITSHSGKLSERKDLSFFLNKYQIENDYLRNSINHLQDWIKDM